VNVTVQNATASETVAVNVSTPAGQEANVSFSSVNVTPTKNASFTLNVTSSEDPIADKTPSVNLSNGTQPLAYLSVDHSITDKNISNVTFTFRVQKDRVNASERDEIALYRFHGGTWNALPTTLVETTDTHYVYRVRSPGLSEFAAGKQRPQFEIANASVEVTTLSVGDSMKVQVRIANDGKADGTFTAELVLEGEPIAERRLTIAADGMRQTTFERTVAEPGTYSVYVNDYRVGEVTVNGTAVDGSTESATGTAADGTDRDATEDDDVIGDTDSTDAGANAGVPGFGVGVAAVALLAGLIGCLRRQ
jgi:PGF-pre-PGF domain-containing protein